MPMYKYANDLDLAWEGFKCYAGSKNVAHTDKYKGFKGNDIPWDNQFEKFKKKYPKGINYTIESDVKASFEEYLRFVKRKE
jgi:propanediol dehydratase large subunit